MNKKEKIDLLVRYFWEDGYTIIKRKFGTYLSEPPKIGNYEIDILARRRKEYAMGICIEQTDLNDEHLLEKIRFLATRKTNFSKNPVVLFIGITNEIYGNVRELIYSLNSEARKNIRLFSLNTIMNNDLFTNKNLDLPKVSNNIFS